MNGNRRICGPCTRDGHRCPQSSLHIPTAAARLISVNWCLSISFTFFDPVPIIPTEVPSQEDRLEGDPYLWTASVGGSGSVWHVGSQSRLN